MHPRKTCLINAGIGQWYSTGSDRLKGSLITHGFDGDIIIWKDNWPSNKFDRSCVYNVKADAFDYAIKAGYETIIWADSSVYALKNTQPFVDLIREKGYWLGQSGHNAAQTCSDACLQYFGIDRDQAQEINDCATGLFGVNITHDIPRQFIERFIKAGMDKAFHGSRKHGGQSSDPRFRFHRQDQSCATIIAAQVGMPLDLFQSFVRFKWDRFDSMFMCQGM